MAHVIIEDEQYIFRRETRNKLFFVLGLGVLLFVVGLIISVGGGDSHAGGEEHSMIRQEALVASTAQGHAAAQPLAEDGARVTGLLTVIAPG